MKTGRSFGWLPTSFRHLWLVAKKNLVRALSKGWARSRRSTRRCSWSTSWTRWPGPAWSSPAGPEQVTQQWLASVQLFQGWWRWATRGCGACAAAARGNAGWPPGQVSFSLFVLLLSLIWQCRAATRLGIIFVVCVVVIVASGVVFDIIRHLSIWYLNETIQKYF